MSLSDNEKKLNALGRKVLKASVITANDITEFNTLRGEPRDSRGVVLSRYLETNRETPTSLVRWIASEERNLLLEASDAIQERVSTTAREMREVCKIAIRENARRRRG